MSHIAGSTMSEGRPLTGRMVLLIILAFFGTIMFANGMMLHFAIQSFSGLEAKNAYMAGLNYNRQIAAERVQDERHWSVDLSVRRVAPGVSEITISQRDASGAPSAALEASIRLAHPMDGRRDQIAQLREVRPGVYRGRVEIAPGHWEAVTELNRRGETVFVSRNRLNIEEISR